MYTQTLGLRLDIDRTIFFPSKYDERHRCKEGVTKDVNALNLIPVWMTLTFIQGHSHTRKQQLPNSFSCKFLSRFGWNLTCCHNLLVETHAEFVLHNECSRERTCVLVDVMEDASQFCLCWDTYERISFKHGVILDTAKHHSLNEFNWPWYCCKTEWSSQNFCDSWLRKEDYCTEIH